MNGNTIMKVKFGFFLLTLLMQSSCATLFTKSSYDILVKSYPESASYVIKDKKGETVRQGQTPDMVKLKGGALFLPRTYSFEFTKKGYKKGAYKTGTRLKGALVLSLLLGGLPIAVDFVSGSAYGIDTDKVEVTLQKDE